MSSDADQFVLQQALDEEPTTSLFQAKRVTYVTDSSSSNGQFSGQLQFDLNTLSSQNQWTDIKNAFIQFPVKVTISSTAALTGVDVNSACIKNGFHQFVDSLQITLGGSTINTSQIYTNVSATYKILSEWSQDELSKYGPTLGISLDDYEGTYTTAGTGVMENVTIANLSPAYVGAEYPATSNTGFRKRAQFLNTNVSAGAADSIMVNTSTNGKGNVQVSTSATTDAFVAFYLATIRLKDLSDAIAKMPPIKNLKGFVYINYNSATSKWLTTTTTSTPDGAITNASLFGRCQPVMVDRTTMKAGSATTITVKSEISGVASTVATAALPAMTNARLYTPYYIASPEIDRMLAQKKTIRYNEQFVSTVSITAGASTNVTITPGIINPKRVILCPLLTGAGDGTAGLTAFKDAPELSPFDIAGCGGTSPFAALSQLQLYTGNQPMFQEPVTFDHQMFLEEVATQGLDGGLNSQTGSGLLSQRLWNEMYRFYTCDISRRINGDDGASKSVQLSATNATNANMRLICIVLHEKEITIDTAMGTVQQGF